MALPRMIRRLSVIALGGGFAALLALLVARPASTGTRTIEAAAGPGAEFVDVGGLRVHVERMTYAGTAEDRPIFVLLHGFGASTFTWRDLMGPLAQLGDVIAYDRPGFGFTDRPERWSAENPYGAAANIRVLDALVQCAAPDRAVILVGHSAGGQLAAEYARVHPERVRGLVLISPAILTAGGPPAWLTSALGARWLSRLGTRLIGSLAGLTEQLLERSFADPATLTDAVRAGYRRPLEVRGWERGLWSFTVAPRITGLPAHLNEIRRPTLLITGDADTIIPTADTESLRRRLPDADLVVLPNAGHLSHEETPAAVVQEITMWLARVIPPTPA